MWVDGRPATLIYVYPPSAYRSSGAAVVRYDGERSNRVVSLGKLRLLPDR